MNQFRLVLLGSLLFAAGCGGSLSTKYTAVADLLVQRQEPHIVPPENGNKESTAEFETYRATQMLLIKHRFVLTVALRNPKCKMLPNLQREDARHNALHWLGEVIQVRCPDERSSVITVSATTSDPQESATLVNAVVEAYMEEVVNRDRLMRREMLDTLQHVAGEKEAELRTEKELIKREMETIGIAKSDSDAFHLQLLTEHASFCQHKLDEVREERRRIEWEIRQRKDSGGETKQLESQLAAAVEQGEFYRKDFDTTTREADHFGRSTVNVAIKQEQVRSLEEVYRRLNQECERLRVDLNAPPRVQIVGDKSAPAAVPERPD